MASSPARTTRGRSLLGLPRVPSFCSKVCRSSTNGRRTGCYIAPPAGLRNEQHLFAEKAGPYADLKPEIANRVLAERTSSLVMAEHSKWVHARSEKTETTTGT
jgi:hypothetical protein